MKWKRYQSRIDLRRAHVKSRSSHGAEHKVFENLEGQRVKKDL